MKKFLLAAVIAISGITYGFTQNKKTLFIILDGIPASQVENVPTPNLDEISTIGGYARAYLGGLKGAYSQTPTISAVGYNSLLTGTWVNKHNVSDNQIKRPNYNYWTIFRHLKNNFPNKTTAVYSTWQDNRTKLVGDNMEETGYLYVDYHFDGFEKDTMAFPHDSLSRYILKIDRKVAAYAAKDIQQKGPDLSWVYLQYTDDIGHRFGYSDNMEKAIIEADHLVGQIWKAVQYRESMHNEEWLVIITTDHGRGEGGFHHGGQSNEERTIWMVTNQKFNAHFKNKPAIVDIFPTIAQHMEVNVPRARAMELDGISLLDTAYAANLTARVEGNRIELTWDNYGERGSGLVWITPTNQFRYGKLDNYQLLGEVELAKELATFELLNQTSNQYKVVLELPTGYLNYWIISAQP